jgi:hypothetical protein
MNGACVECVANQRRCNTARDGVEVCDTAGHWQPAMQCAPGTCVDPGECAPDAGANR